MAARVVYATLNIWRARNETVFSGTKFRTNTVIDQANSVWQDWLKVVCQSELRTAHVLIENHNSHSIELDNSIWVNPPPGWDKVNSDACFDSQTNEFYAAAVCRNYKGETLWSTTKGGKGRCALEGEAMGLELGMGVAKANEERNVFFETDSGSLEKKDEGRHTS